MAVREVTRVTPAFWVAMDDVRAISITDQRVRFHFKQGDCWLEVSRMDVLPEFARYWIGP